MENLELDLDSKGTKKFFEDLIALSTIEENKKYPINIDYGNGKSIQVIGYFKSSIKSRYRRKKRGKKYKYFKTKFLNIWEIQFIGNKII